MQRRSMGLWKTQDHRQAWQCTRFTITQSSWSSRLVSPRERPGMNVAHELCKSLTLLRYYFWHESLATNAQRIIELPHHSTHNIVRRWQLSSRFSCAINKPLRKVSLPRANAEFIAPRRASQELITQGGIDALISVDWKQRDVVAQKQCRYQLQAGV